MNENAQNAIEWLQNLLDRADEWYEGGIVEYAYADAPDVVEGDETEIVLWHGTMWQDGARLHHQDERFVATIYWPDEENKPWRAFDELANDLEEAIDDDPYCDKDFYRAIVEKIRDQSTTILYGDYLAA